MQVVSSSTVLPRPIQTMSMVIRGERRDAGQLQATCILWASRRTVVSIVSEVRLASPIATVEPSSTMLVLSSAEASLPARPIPVIHLTVEEDPSLSFDNGWCTTSLAEPLANVTTVGAVARFAAPDMVSLDPLTILGTYRHFEEPLVATVRADCEHSSGARFAPVTINVIVAPLAIEWVTTALPKSIGTGEQWPVVKVRVSAATLESLRLIGSDLLGSVALCRASTIPVASRITGSTASLLNDGTATLTELTITGARGRIYSLRVTCSVGSLAVPPVLHHAFLINGCPVGQQPRPGSEDLCEVCAVNSYSDGIECMTCPAVGVLCIDGILLLRDKFFRPDGERHLPITNASELHPCFNDEACLVNSSSRSYSCLTGYEGPLCGVCSEGFAMFGVACRHCWSSEWSQMVVALLVVAFLGAVGYLAARAAREGSANALMKRDHDDAGEDSSNRAVATRIVLSHLQALGALSVYRAYGTSVFRDMLSVTLTVSATPLSWGPIQCALNLDFVDRFWGTLALVPVIMVAVVGTYLLMAVISRQSVENYFAQRRWLVALTLILFLAYMPVMKLMITTLDCYDRSVGGRWYLEADLGVECFGPTHLPTVVVAVLVLLGMGLGFPVFVLRSLRQGSDLPQSTQAGLAFLSQGYETSYQWWEAVVLIRKAGLVLLGALIPDAAVQTSIAVLLLGSALWLQEHFKPYVDGRFDSLESLSLATLAFTSSLSLVSMQLTATYRTTDSDQAVQAINIIEAIVTTLLIVGNVVVIFLLVWRAARASHSALRSIQTRLPRRLSVLIGGKPPQPLTSQRSARRSRPSVVGKEITLAGERILIESPLALKGQRIERPSIVSKRPRKGRPSVVSSVENRLPLRV